MPEAANPERFTEADWSALDHHMVWSIRDRESAAQFDAEDPPGETDEEFWARYDRVLLDLSAPAGVADGVYEVRFDYLRLRGIGQGAVVKNGRFDPRSAADAALQAACDAFMTTPDHLDHVFIEHWEYDPETGQLIVDLGS